MAKRNLKAVDSGSNEKEFTDAIYEIQTCLWRIKALSKTIDFDAMSDDNNLSDQDQANIASTIGMLASLGTVATEDLESYFDRAVQDECARRQEVTHG